MTKDDEAGLTYTAEQVSQGQVVLRTTLRKAVFIGGLMLFVIVAIVFAFAAHG